MPLLGNFGGRVGIYRFVQSPPIPRRLPSLFICRELFSFCNFNSVRARLQALGLAQGTAISAVPRVIFEGIVNYNSLIYLICCVSSLFCSTIRRVWKNNSLKLQKIPFMKNYGITLIRWNYATSGRQNFILKVNS